MANNPNDPAMLLTRQQYTHPPGILVSDHYIQPYGYACYREQGTKDWLIIYTLSGQGWINNGDKGYLSCTPGTLTMVSPGTIQDYFTEEGEVWEKLWAHFIPRLSWADWMPTSNTDGPLIQLDLLNEYSRQAIESALWRVISYRLHGDAALRDELTLNALEEVILLVASQNQSQKTLDARVQEVLNIITQEYTGQLLIEDLGKRVCLSPSRLSHLFKEQVGDTIMGTLMKHRLKQAEKLLKYTLRPVTEIALSVGFHSPDYFSRQFATHFGVTPSNYRKASRNVF
ncbi:AraC family transcriptional regulator of arabinose operon [Paenibacillus amylolyticus]|uniref:AraC family transcriptional regulator of arabinose operon n=1 Tax=Paenibacillus amylolyticus TaxID=1451 RepID=A0AAP5LNS7_PAEAM|nr:helix-turn-helix domain-containing protein [Paenibacillus amylolyticus]MDR6721819.1 AraC family transcriptional regulator of arabinose operon [Paenibacillus amylolyticus]